MGQGPDPETSVFYLFYFLFLLFLIFLIRAINKNSKLLKTKRLRFLLGQSKKSKK